VDSNGDYGSPSYLDVVEKIMGILDNFEASLDFDTFKIKCTKCQKTFIASFDVSFVCLMCSA